MTPPSKATGGIKILYTASPMPTTSGECSVATVRAKRGSKIGPRSFW